MTRMDEAGTPSERDAMKERDGRGFEHYLIMGIALVALAAALVLGLCVDPDPRGFGTHEQLGLAPCRTMEVIGIPCPGCGVTTSVSLLWHGDLWASFTNQPFGFLMGLLVPFTALGAFVRHLRGRDLYADTVKMRWGRWLLGLGSVMVAAWIYKLIQL